MLLSEKFLKVICEANKASPNLTGQLFAYIAKIDQFQMVKSHGPRNVFQKRWIFLIFVAVNMLLRIIDYKVVMEIKTHPLNQI